MSSRSGIRCLRYASILEYADGACARTPENQAPKLLTEMRLQGLLIRIPANQTWDWPQDKDTGEPLFKDEERDPLRPFLDNRQSYQVPVDRNLAPSPARYRPCLRACSPSAGVDGLAVDRKLLLKYSQFFGAFLNSNAMMYS